DPLHDEARREERLPEKADGQPDPLDVHHTASPRMSKSECLRYQIWRGRRTVAPAAGGSVPPMSASALGSRERPSRELYRFGIRPPRRGSRRAGTAGEASRDARPVPPLTPPVCPARGP